jgi:hypothetical protein
MQTKEVRMSKNTMGMRGLFLIVAVAVTAAVSWPTYNAAAQGAPEPTPPPAVVGSTARLEQAWEREQMVHKRMADLFDSADARIAGIQGRVDRAKAKGRDVSNLQAALDALASQIKQTRPEFDGASEIMLTHHGFDTSGHVTDGMEARHTVMDLAVKLRDIHGKVTPAVIAWRDAVRAFRQLYAPTTVPSATPAF